MTLVFHAWLCGRFIEIQSNLRRKKLHKTNLGSFLIGVLAIEIMQKSQSNLEETVNPSILKDDFSARRHPSIFTSIAPACKNCIFFVGKK